MHKIALVILIILVFIIMVLGASILAEYRFNKEVDLEAGELYGNAKNNGAVIQNSDLEGLPPVVKKWLEESRIVGKEEIKTVYLKQKAAMRLKPEQSWLAVDAEQYFTTEEPGFIWKAQIKAAPLLHIMGRDKYYEGKGNMRIKFMSLITIADSSGTEIDQGTLIRYLAETVWFPSAALSSHITWEEIDANSARATMSYGGVTGSGVFIFNEKGEVVEFTAERYMESEGRFTLEKWSVQVTDYKEFNGIMIPAQGEVIWKLKSGDFNWYHCEITQIKYN